MVKFDLATTTCLLVWGGILLSRRVTRDKIRHCLDQTVGALFRRIFPSKPPTNPVSILRRPKHVVFEAHPEHIRTFESDEPTEGRPARNPYRFRGEFIGTFHRFFWDENGGPKPFPW